MEGPTSKGTQRIGTALKSPVKLLSPIVHTKTIYLHDWWLMRGSKGDDGIAVGGFTIRREGVETAFCSALIKERHDSSSLESLDGFTIFISGPINRSVTEQNGFPPEVCSHFVNGFPYNWEDFSSQHVREGSTHVDSRTGFPDGSHTFSSGSFQDMSFHQMQDLLLSTHELYDEDALTEYISNDLVAKLKSAVINSTDDLTRECDLPRANESEELQEKGLNLTRVRTRRMEKSAVINSTDDLTRDCDLPRANESKELKEKARCPSLNLNRVCTRRMASLNRVCTRRMASQQRLS